MAFSKIIAYVLWKHWIVVVLNKSTSNETSSISNTSRLFVSKDYLRFPTTNICLLEKKFISSSKFTFSQQEWYWTLVVTCGINNKAQFSRFLKNTSTFNRTITFGLLSSARYILLNTFTYYPYLLTLKYTHSHYIHFTQRHEKIYDLEKKSPIYNTFKNNFLL